MLSANYWPNIFSVGTENGKKMHDCTYRKIINLWFFEVIRKHWKCPFPWSF